MVVRSRARSVTAPATRVELLRYYFPMSSPAPGRNDPCPCGSGRKFKHCCLRATEGEDALRVRLRTVEGHVVPALFAYAIAEFGEEFFDEAWEEFFVWADAPEDPRTSPEFDTTFMPWFVFSFIPDDAEEDLPDGWPTQPVALHFLEHEVEGCPDLDREFIVAACKSHPSFFTVEAVTPGRDVTVRDILTGRRFRALEQGASRTLRIPALGDKTPRQAAKTPRGRERLEALLATYARRHEERPTPYGLDLPSLREKLGLSPPRT